MPQPNPIFAECLNHQTREIIAFTDFRKPEHRQELNCGITRSTIPRNGRAFASQCHGYTSVCELDGLVPSGLRKKTRAQRSEAKENGRPLLRAARKLLDQRSQDFGGFSFSFGLSCCLGCGGGCWRGGGACGRSACW